MEFSGSNRLLAEEGEGAAARVEVRVARSANARKEWSRASSGRLEGRVCQEMLYLTGKIVEVG